MKISKWVGTVASVALALGVPVESFAGDKAGDPVARGRYLRHHRRCNDCHTDGYLQNGGNVPEGDWLKGTVVGYQGPWGTTYAPT